MSNTDSFIEEVTEEVRRDRMYALWRRYGPYVIGAIAAFILLAAVKTWLDQRAEAAARAAGGALLTASEGDLAKQAAALEELARTADHDGERVLARLRAAGAWAAAGDPQTALRLYDELAADGSVDPLLQDFAVYRSLAIRVENMDPAQQADAWERIADGGSAFRLLALEARGLALVRAGRKEEGAEELRAAYFDPAAPQGLRQRIEAAAAALDVSLEASS